MHPMLKMMHDAEVRKIQQAIREKKLVSGRVITEEKGDTFEINVFVLPVSPAEKIELKLDPKLEDDKLTLEDFGL